MTQWWEGLPGESIRPERAPVSVPQRDDEPDADQDDEIVSDEQHGDDPVLDGGSELETADDEVPAHERRTRELIPRTSQSPERVVASTERIAIPSEPPVDFARPPAPPTGNGHAVSAPTTSVLATERGRSSSATGELVAQRISAWFGSNKVLEDVNLLMRARSVTALIGPSGCGKSTFLRILNRMHELVPIASLSGRVLLDSSDIYAPEQRPTDTRRQIGMVFQKPNPFPAMSIYDNVLAGPRLTRTHVDDKDGLVEESLRRAGLWNEVRSRLHDAGGALSGGQQQRLCIARSLAIRPQVLLMDEPCSALDPTSTRRIEDTIDEISHDVTVVIVTHNMQQAQRVSHHCAFFLAGENEPGRIVEEGPTDEVFNHPKNLQTNDYVNGRFG